MTVQTVRKTLQESVTRSDTGSPFSSADQRNLGRGVDIIIDITAISGVGADLTVQVQQKDQLSGEYVDIPGAVTAALTATGTTRLTVYPGITVAANVSVSDAVGADWRVTQTITGTTPSVTYSIGASEIG